MAASNAQSGFGVILKRGGIAIAELTNVEPPEIKRNTWDKTTHQSPGRVMEKGKGLVEIGDINIEGNWLPTDSTHNAATGLLSDFSNHTSNDTYAIVFPDTANTTWTGKGILSSFKPTSPQDDGMKFSATIVPDGQWTIS